MCVPELERVAFLVALERVVRIGGAEPKIGFLRAHFRGYVRRSNSLVP